MAHVFRHMQLVLGGADFDLTPLRLRKTAEDLLMPTKFQDVLI